MDISDYSTYFRGRAYTRYKKYKIAQKLAFYLEHGSTITYYPERGFWTVTHSEVVDKEVIELQCLIHCGW